MSVESVTAQMATTSLAEPTGTAQGATVGAGGDQPINASQNEAVLASAAEGRRLYIGNLAYATTEGELKEFFKDYQVETISIPTNPRTTRPVGYAFVDVTIASETDRAINDLNGKTILERKVSVQVARTPEPAGEGEGGEGQRRRFSTRGRGGRRGGRGGRAGRGGRVSRPPLVIAAPSTDILRKKDTNGDVVNGTPAEVPAEAPAETAGLATTTNEAHSGEDGVNGDANQTSKFRAARPRKQRGPPEDGIPSKNKIMVANLPYDLREEKLLEIFADYSPTAAKIALRPIPKFMVRKLQARNEPRKGRGFGFVTLSSEEMQTKACDDMNGKEIEGREIAVKVAIDSPGKEDEDPNTTTERAAEVETTQSAVEGSANVTTATA